MKSLKKTLSLVLALCLVFSLMGVAGAADFKDDAKITHTEAVQTNVALNIINGRTDGSFDPAGTVTRAEMCKMIAVALNGGKAPVMGTQETPTFTDIKGTWGEAYIEYCANLGIIAGMGDGTFKPDDTITGVQAAKMMLVAMDYNSEVFKFTGPKWAINVTICANKAELFAELSSINPSEGMDRDSAAQLIYNGIFAGTMVLGWNKDLSTGEVVQTYRLDTTKTVASEKYGLTVQTATMGNTTYNAVKKEYTYSLSNATKVNGPASTVNSITTTVDYSALYDMNVKVLFKNENGKVIVYGVYPFESNVILSGVFGQMAATAVVDNANNIIKYNGETYKFDNLVNTPVRAINDGANSYVGAFGPIAKDTLGAYIKNATTSTLPSNTPNPNFNPFLASYAFKMLDTDADNSIDSVVFYPYSVPQITYLGTENATIAGNSYLLKDINLYEDAKVGDYVKFTAAANTATGVNTFEKITPFSGKVTAVANGSATINDTTMGDLVGLTLDATYENIYQVNGFIRQATLKVDAASADKFAVVAKAGAHKNAYDQDVATLLFANGDKKEVAVSAQARTGDFVTYTVSSGVYTLTSVSASNKGNFTGYANPAANTYNYTKGTIGSVAIDDGAVVFAKTNSGYKVITGAVLKTAHAFTANPKVLTKYNASTGFSTILCTSVDISNQVVGATKYGYVTNNVARTKNADGDTVSLITFWNGTEEVKAKLADDNYTDLTVVNHALAKGDFFRYTEDADGIMSIVDEISGGKVDFFNPASAAVTAYDTTNNTISFNNSTPAQINEDTIIFNVDCAANKGVPGNAIVKANGMIPNAKYLTDTDNFGNRYVVFVVIDTKGHMQTGTTYTITKDSPTASEINSALASYTTVTVTGTMPITDVIVPANKTLIIKKDQALDLSKIKAADVNAVVKFDSSVVTGASDYTNFYKTANAGGASIAASAASDLTDGTYKWLANGADDRSSKVPGWLKQ